MKKQTKGYGYDLLTLEPIPKSKAVRFVRRWINETPSEKTIYAEFTIGDVLSLFARNSLKFPTHVRLYNAINDSGQHTQVLVTSRKKGEITIEIDANDSDYGEDFGTLSPPAGNYNTDDLSLAALAMKPEKSSRKKGKSTKKKK